MRCVCIKCNFEEGKSRRRVVSLRYGWRDDDDDGSGGGLELTPVKLSSVSLTCADGWML